MTHRNARLLLVAVALLIALPFAAFAETNGARSGTALGGPPPVCPGEIPAACTGEGFEDITTLPGAGWFSQNNSSPLGLNDWFQGNDTVFPAQAGTATSYLGANFNSTSGAGTISTWMLTPEIDLSAIDTLTFYTRTATESSWPDRLQVRYSTNGASTNVGTLATDVGDFTNLALDINPTLAVGGYPEAWTLFTLTAADITAAGTGRIAFRYFVTDGGPSGNNSNYIGIDTYQFCTLDGADLAIAKSVTPATVVPGANATFTLDVTNNGPAAAAGVTVTDSLPAGLTYVSDSCGASYAAPTVTWAIGALANGASVSCDIVVTVDQAGSFPNSATVTGTGLDPVSTNNDGSATVTGQQALAEIPTLGTVGLLALALGLVGVSFALLRRRRLS